MTIMSRLGAFCAAFAMVLSCAAAEAQICAPSNAVGLDGIGDGCTTSYKGVDGSYFIADVGIFKGTFTTACNHHDKCYTTLGTTYTQCDDTLLSEMRSACSSNYNPILLPGVYTQCTATAQTYYYGVKGYGAAMNPLPGFQAEALGRAGRVAANVIASPSTCGTTPELTTLFDASVIAQVDNQFQSVAHRLPTIYEFMGLFSTGSNYVNDRTSWNAALVQASYSANANAAPPTAAYTSTTTDKAVVYTATSNKPRVSFVWKLNGITLNQASIPLNLHNPPYDTSWPVTGFVQVSDLDTGERNMALVNTFVIERGWCDAKDNHTPTCPRLREL